MSANAGYTHPRMREWLSGLEALRDRVVKEHELAFDTPVTWSIRHEVYCPRREFPLKFSLPCVCLPEVQLFYGHISDPDEQPPIKAMTGIQLADYGEGL